MIIGLSIIVWIFVTAIAVAVFCIVPVRTVRPALQWTGWSVTLILSCLFLFRPEEEIEVGEDPGVYFHSAMFLAQQQTFSSADPALSEVAPHQRTIFRYGDPSFMITKDHHLWSQDESMHEVGSFFLPGYPLMLALPMALGWPYFAFWVAPILAIMTGLVLARLATALTASAWAGWLAYILYVLNPIIAWNARCIRAEQPASFLVLAGLFLLLMSWFRLPGRVSRLFPFLAGLALSSATLFHITAIYVTIPVLVIAFWYARQRPFHGAWWMGIGLGFSCLFLQLIFVSDPYWILPNLLNPSRRRVALIAVVVLLALGWGLKQVWIRLARRVLRGDAHKELLARLAGVVLGLLFVAMVALAMKYPTDTGHLPGLPEWTAAYLSITDFEGVRLMISRVALGFALIGIVVMNGLAGTAGRMARFLFLTLAPASLTIGWVHNYLFETRRMATFLVPLLVLATILLIFTITPYAYRFTRRLRLPSYVWPIGIAAFLVFVMVRGRDHLYTTWNYKGLYRYYANIASDISEQGDFLFAEYTQTAIPIERLSGRPLLPLAWGYRSESEYRSAEKIFARLTREHPERRHLFITPFDGAVLPGLHLDPLQQYAINSKRVDRARRSVPQRVLPFDRTLHVYRVSPPVLGAEMSPYVRVLDGSRMGLDRMANWMPNRSILVQGVPLAAGQTHKLNENNETDAQWVVIYAHEELTKNDHLTQITGNFYLWRSAPGVELSFDHDVLLLDQFAVREPGIVSRVPWASDEIAEITIPGIHSQWMRAVSSIAMPRDGHHRYALFFATPGREDGVKQTMRLMPSDGSASSETIALFPEWRWYVVPLQPTSATAAYWHELIVDPAWDPGLSNFPADLGLLIHAIAIF